MSKLLLPVDRRAAPYTNDSRQNVWMRARRIRLRAANICVNGITHGPPVKGGRCQPCWDKKKAAERRTPS